MEPIDAEPEAAGPTDDEPLSAAGTLLVAAAVGSLILAGLLAGSLPVAAVLWTMTKAEPGWLEIDGWLPLLTLATVITGVNVVADVALSAVLRRRLPLTMTGDLARRMWLFAFGYAVVALAFRLTPGVTARSAWPVVVLAVVGLAVDWIVDVVSAMRRSGSDRPLP